MTCHRAQRLCPVFCAASLAACLAVCLALCLALCLAGCAAGPDYQAPQPVLPSAYGTVPTAGTVTTSGGATEAADLNLWWRALQDTELDSLVERAVKANPDLLIALAHLQEARTQEAGLTGALLPSVSADAIGGGGTGSDLSRAGGIAPLRAADNKGSLAQIRQVAGFSASWELDVFGGYRRQREASRDAVGAAIATRNAALTSVIGDLARDYLLLRGLQQREQLLQADIQAATQSRNLQRARVERGIVNELDLQLTERELGILRAQQPLLLSQITAAQGSIAALLGVYPEDLASELARPAPLPGHLPEVAAGVPPDLLRRRPDIMAAERRLAGATASIGIATAQLFPQLMLTGASGIQAATPGLSGNHIWAAGPALYWPLLDFGQLDAQVSVAGLKAREQLQAYRRTVIHAVVDADRAIADYQAQQQRLQELGLALKASLRAEDLAQQRYDRGLTDYLNVVDSQRQRYALEENYNSAREAAASAFVTLCQALGGGWQTFQDVPPIRHPLPAVVAGLKHAFSSD